MPELRRAQGSVVSVIGGGSAGGLVGARTFHPFNQGAQPDTATGARLYFATAGSIRRLRAVNEGQPGVGSDATLTVHKNGAATELAVTFTNADADGTLKSDDDSVAIAVNDYIDMRTTVTLAPGIDIAWSLEFVPT